MLPPFVAPFLTGHEALFCFAGNDVGEAALYLEPCERGVLFVFLASAGCLGKVRSVLCAGGALPPRYVERAVCTATARGHVLVLEAIGEPALTLSAAVAQGNEALFRRFVGALSERSVLGLVLRASEYACGRIFTELVQSRLLTRAQGECVAVELSRDGKAAHLRVFLGAYPAHTELAVWWAVYERNEALVHALARGRDLHLTETEKMELRQLCLARSVVAPWFLW